MKTLVGALLLGIAVPVWAAGYVSVQDGTTPGRTLKINADGSINTSVTGGPGGTATSTSVAQTGASVVLLAANTNRIEAIISNTSGVTCNIGLGVSAASTTGPLLQAGAVYVEDHFTGAINSNCASGAVAVTEVTP